MKPAFRAGETARSIPLLVDWRIGGRCADWALIGEKRCAIAVGVDEPGTRANLIQGGFADALSSQVALVELAARALKLDGVNEMIPQHRNVGPVRLDLFYRDAYVDDKWIGLHPREFALMWRLAEVPGQRVDKAELLSDVWRLRHEPETNSLEVHISRLRAKLAISGLGWLVQTHQDGGYFICTEARSSFTAFSRERRTMLDRSAPITQSRRPDQPNLAECHVQRTRID
ncbi:winged helix-turn-helix domain-containing protein [Qipengyuania psychrotolerans]|nr:winged helix-turn-helix domain-containing protein [Qipengyuania psychrotolerans]